MLLMAQQGILVDEGESDGRSFAGATIGHLLSQTAARSNGKRKLLWLTPRLDFIRQAVCAKLSSMET